MRGLQQLFSSDLAIPLWQIVLYVGLVSYFMVQRWFKLSFLTSFILVLYWLHFAFRADLVALTTEAHLARAIYYVLGFALILLSIFALTFLEVDADSLLAKREKEIAFLKAQAKNAEKTAAGLQAQLEKDQNQDGTGKKKREKKLSANIEKLEHGLEEAEHLLETRDAEIAALKTDSAEAQKNASALEALLAMYQTQESNIKTKLEAELNAKIDALQDRLRDGESFLEQRDAEIAALKARAADLESNASALEARSQGAAESERASHVAQELRAQIDQLKDELGDKEALLEKRNAKIAELQARASQLEAKTSAVNAELQKKLDGQAAAARKSDEELTRQIDQLKSALQESESLITVRSAEVAEFRTTVLEADKKAAALQAQLEKEQSQGSISKKQLQEKVNAKVSQLETQLKQRESLIQKRSAEIAELQGKAADAEKHAGAVKAQFEKDQSQESAANKKLQEELDARIVGLADQLKQAEALLAIRQTEIAELKARARSAETDVSNLRGQLEKEQAVLATANIELKEALNGRIANLENDLQQAATVLETRNAEIAQLRVKAADAQNNALGLKTRLEKDHESDAAANRNLARELNGKIVGLEEKLKQYDALLENRNSEIAALNTRASQAEKSSTALAAQVEEDNARLDAVHTKLKEELGIKMSDFETQLQQSERLLNSRDTEVVELKANAAQAEKSAAVLKAQLEKYSTQATSAKKSKDELNGRLTKLEAQLKQGETLLKVRNSEIATLQAKASDAEKSALALKAQLEKDTTQVSSNNKKLEAELNAKIAKLEDQLKESESLMQKRDAESADFKAKAADAIKSAAAIKPSSPTNRQSLQAQAADDKSTSEDEVRRKLHQFQYAVKYLEDEIKEKDRLLGLMTKKNAQAQPAAKNTIDDDFKKKIHALEQTVKYLENQAKEKDGLLSLMTKRNRELADLKSKAEEKLEALESNTHGDQVSKGAQPDADSER